MYPHQHRPQPPSPTGRLVGPVPCVPSGYPSHQLPGNAPRQMPPLQFATYPRPGYVQAYPQQVVHHPPPPRLISGHYVNAVSPQKCDVIPGGPQQQQQFWQQVVLSPYPPPQQQQQQQQQQIPQHQVQPGETVIYGGGGYMTQQVENRFQHQNISAINQISQNSMLSMDPTSQNTVSYLHGHSQQGVHQQQQQQQFPVQYTFPTTSTTTSSHENQQHSNLNQSQFTQVRFQTPLLSPSSQQQQQQLQQVVQLQQSEGSVMFINSTATSSLTTATTTTTTTNSSVVGNSVFIQQQLIQVVGGQQVEKVSVPWSWTRRVTSESVIFVSPSGVELKSMDEVKEYLLTEGTCKCGLDCPLEVEKVFDFDAQKPSEPFPIPDSVPQPSPSRHCSQRSRIASMAMWEKSSGNKIVHIQNPISKNGKRPSRKKKPLSGVLTKQMIEAKEAERRRINEIILEQKRQYEAQMSFTSVSQPLLMTTTATATTTTATTATEMSTKDSLHQTPTNTAPMQQQQQHEANTNSDQKLATSAPTTKTKSEKQKDKDKKVPKTNVSNKLGLQKPFEGSKDVSKNIEIRRMSATEEGDKVLNSAWDSPEKEEKGRTPLEMVQNIVASMERPQQNNVTDIALSKKVNHPQPTSEPPAWTQTLSRPLQHSQTMRPNFTSPSNAVPTLLSRSSGPPNVTVLGPPPFGSMGGGVVQMAMPQVLQLVNTVNGPMLVPEGQAHLHQYQPQQQQQQQQLPSESLKSPVKSNPEPPKMMIPRMQGPHHPILMSPGHQLIAIAQPHQQQMTDRGSTVQISPQGHPQQQQQQQPVFLNQATPMFSGNPMILSNGMVAMPAPQGFVQMPDGTLVQMQTGPTIMTSPMPLIMNHQPGNGGQLIQGSNGGTLLLSPTQGGLVQMSGIQHQTSYHQQHLDQQNYQTIGPGQGHLLQGGLQQVSPNQQIMTYNVSPQQQHQQQQQQQQQQQFVKTSPTNQNHQISPKRTPPSQPSALKSKPVITDDDSDDEEPLYASNDEEEDTDSDEDDDNEDIIKYSKSLMKKSSSSSSSKKKLLQSNKVDSSGLKATPPHHTEEVDQAASSTVKLSSPGDMTHSQQDGNDSLDTSGTSISLGLHSPSKHLTPTTTSSPTTTSTKSFRSSPFKRGPTPTKRTSDLASSPSKRRRKRNADELLNDGVRLNLDEDSDDDGNFINSTPTTTVIQRHFKVGEVVWGPHGSSPSWPGKITSKDDKRARVFWFGNRETSEVDHVNLKSLSEGLEAHHIERQKLRKGRRMNPNLEKAIQEAMADLDRMSTSN